ncbi:hypothetical protein FJW07_05855 [Mesorhizobium sp. B3-1-9]|nr:MULTISPECIES: hypothetical protein [unclassified Mesorhizobium]TPI36076.1 hypothetical protein FJ414_16550 [Mesorhizobium sp. B3-1-6]TPI42021.1 hypothetical protein FJW07_05855 [Mesorhizobium sp. B3-1-9]TPI70789.1 hypothetical protein FJ424_02825 [Mesorhizobium sp. B3-1-8]TPI74455.1 hypothetical protein FJ420_05890 [Mesorhizobium sp. B3-1-3]TPJ32683.1 hypothetical protein FJ418_18305 [Mesorhizobium sp. B2-8-3]
MHRFSIIAASLVATTFAYAADAPQPLAGETVVTPHISGYGEIYLGGLRFTSIGDTVHAAGGAARVNIPFAQRWNFQGDLTYDRIWDDDFAHWGGVGGAIHGYYRDPDRFAAGVFATYTSVDFGDFDGKASSWAVGPEAQIYFGNLTLYGQAAFGRANEDSLNSDQWNVRAVARYFVQDNLRLDAELSFSRTDQGVNLDVSGGALQAMYRFNDTPWSVFARYQLEQMKIGSTDLGETHKYLVGLRASFGSKSLLEEDRNGAAMDTYRPNEVKNLSVK